MKTNFYTWNRKPDGPCMRMQTTCLSNATGFTAAEGEESRSAGTMSHLFGRFSQNSSKKAAITHPFTKGNDTSCPSHPFDF